MVYPIPFQAFNHPFFGARLFLESWVLVVEDCFLDCQQMDGWLISWKIWRWIKIDDDNWGSLLTQETSIWGSVMQVIWIDHGIKDPASSKLFFSMWVPSGWVLTHGHEGHGMKALNSCVFFEYFAMKHMEIWKKHVDNNMGIEWDSIQAFWWNFRCVFFSFNFSRYARNGWFCSQFLWVDEAVAQKPSRVPKALQLGSEAG